MLAGWESRCCPPAARFTTLVGAGAREDPTPTILTDGDTINSYAGGESAITVPADGETLDVYAFR
jgi:hypothetical protein